jgi:hypothetical protein
MKPNVTIDPFNPPQELSEVIANKESEGTYNVSLILEIFYNKLDKLDVESLDPHQKETVEKLKQLTDYMSRIAIVGKN